MNNQNKKNNTACVLFFVLLVGFSSNSVHSAAVPVRVQERKATAQKAPVQGSSPVQPVSVKRLASIPYLSADNSAKAAREVRQTIHDHKMGSRMLTIIACGKKLYGFYSMVKEMHYDYSVFNSDSKKSSDNDDSALAEKKEPAPGWWDSLCTEVSSLGSLAKWGSIVKVVGKQLGIVAGDMVTSMVINKALETVTHEDTIFWFIEKQTSYQQSMHDLITYAQLLEKNEGAQEDKALHKKAFVHTARDLMHQIEKIVGYVNYKASIVKNHAGVLGDISQDIVSKSNRVIELLNTEINGGGVVACTALLQEFSRTIETSFDRSAAFDPHAKTQIQNFLIAKNNKEYAKVGHAIVKLPKVAQDKVDALLREYSK